MDPLTIGNVGGNAFAVASGAWNVGQALYTLFQEAEDVDYTASAFANEVTALGTACGAVGKRLQNIGASQTFQELRNATSEPSELWKCLESQLRACEATVKELKAAVSCVTISAASKKNQALFSLATRQITLNMRAAGIAEARNRVQSHTASLQLVLQAFTIEVVYLSPQRVDQQFQARLAGLTVKMQELEELRARRGDDWRQDHVSSNEEDILRASEGAVSSGEKLYASSMAGVSIPKDTTHTKSNYVKEWIQHTNALENAADGLLVNATAPKSPRRTVDQMSQSRAPKSLGDASVSVVEDRDNESHELDSVEDFNVEAAAAAISEGQALFDAKDYASADATLHEALQMIRELPIKHQKVGDPCDIRFMLGVCAFHLQTPSTAEEALLSVVENTPKAKVQNNVRRRQVLDAGHLLAITYMRLGKLEQARIYCDSTLLGRRRLVGKNDPSSHESLALLARVLELQGKESRSRILVSMLPPDTRGPLIRSVSDLSSHSSAQSSEEQETTAPQETKIEAARASSRGGTPTSPTPFNKTAPDQPMPFSETDKRHTRTPTLAFCGNISQKGIASVCTEDYQRPQQADAAERQRRWTLLGRPRINTKLALALLLGRTQQTVALTNQRKAESMLSRVSNVLDATQLKRIGNIHLAALFGDYEIVKTLIAKGADLHAPFSNLGLSPLHCAAMGGYVNIAEAIILAGGTVDCDSPTYGTPLSIAVMLERLDVVDLLLQHGADVNSVSGSLGSVMHAASMTGNTRLFESLCRRTGCNLRKSCPVRLDNVRWLRSLLDEETRSPETPEAIFADGSNPRTLDPSDSALYWIVSGLAGIAAYFDHAKAIQLLHEQRIDIQEQCCVDTMTQKSLKCDPLTLAALGGAEAAMEMLLMNGACIQPSKRTKKNRKDLRYNDPLMHAILNRHQACAVLLLDHGAQIEQEDLQRAAKQELQLVVDKAREMGFILLSPSMNLFVQTLTGKTMSYHVRSDNTVHDLMVKIKDEEGIATDQQHLIYEGRRLEEEQKISSYKIPDNSTFSLVVRLRDESSRRHTSTPSFGKRPTYILVKTLDGGTWSVPVDVKDSVAALKVKIAHMHGVPLEQQKLIHGDELLDDGLTLEDYGIRNESTVRLVLVFIPNRTGS